MATAPLRAALVGDGKGREAAPLALAFPALSPAGPLEKANPPRRTPRVLTEAALSEEVLAAQGVLGNSRQVPHIIELPSGVSSWGPTSSSVSVSFPVSSS